MILFLRDLFRRVRAVFLRRRLDRELEDELQMHVEMESRKYVLSGVPPAEAERRARIAFGGRTQTTEACRESRGLTTMENVFRDLTYALRGFRRSPGFAFTVVLTLAIAVGANLTVFNFCQAMLSAVLPVPNPDQLSLATIFYPGHPEIRYFSYPDLRQMQEACKGSQLTGFTDLVAVHLRDPEGTTSTFKGQLVAENFFSALQISPRLGRIFDQHDNRTGTEDVAVISYRLWSTKFGGDESILGKRVIVQHAPVTVVGVMPEGFDGVVPGERTDMWMPLSAQANIGFGGYASLNNIDGKQPWLMQDVSWLHLLARSPSDPSGKQLLAALTHYLRNQVDSQLPNVQDAAERSAMLGAHVNLRSAAGGLPGLKDRFSLPLKVLVVLVTLLLISGCLNIVNLILARARAQEQEMAVRLSLGSGRGRLIAQRAAEILLLCIFGGILSFPIALWGSKAISYWLQTEQSIQIEVDMNGKTLAFAAMLTLAASLLISVIPALRTRDIGLSRSLGLRTAGAGRRSSRLSTNLIAAQLGFSVVSITVAGLLVHTLSNYERLNIGVDRNRTLSVSLDPAAAGYTTVTRQNELYRRLTATVDRIPGVESSSVAGCGMMEGGCAFIEAAVIGSNAKATTALVERNYVGPGYFTTTGMQLLRGRSLSDEDRAGSQPVAVVNQEFEKQFLHGQSAIGHNVQEDGKTVVIVGVVNDARSDDIRRQPSPFLYLPIAQAGAWDISRLEVRTAGAPAGVASAVRSAILGIDRAIPIAEIVTLVEETNRGLARELLLGRLAVVFSVLSMTIAAVGLYGLVNYEVSQRRGEFAIRMAVGATRGTILHFVLAQSALIWAIGCFAGLLVSVGISKIIESLLFEVTKWDPLTYICSLLALLLVSTAAVVMPAWRAASIDPASALRNQ
jgi:predicted permease